MYDCNLDPCAATEQTGRSLQPLTVWRLEQRYRQRAWLWCKPQPLAGGPQALARLRAAALDLGLTCQAQSDGSLLLLDLTLHETLTFSSRFADTVLSVAHLPGEGRHT